MWAGALLYSAFFLALVIAYDVFAETGSERLLLAFPIPTALMLYGVGLSPLFFTVLYMLRFEPWILDNDELAGFLEETKSLPDGGKE